MANALFFTPGKAKKIVEERQRDELVLLRAKRATRRKIAARQEQSQLSEELKEVWE
ncbi:hypothetical protein [Pseudoalteromonas rubra]|uniref:hypothetical protein n=1 Tax=Pseudoalteromonas rubra TaxID=43658 RepID=UPI0013DE1A8B|nr:hypothetical protein [Pseudoalteromonas rubra]